MRRSCIFGRQVFLKYFHVEQLNIAVSEFARHITACQKYVRGLTARRRYVSMKQLARKCEEDMKELNGIVMQLTDCLKPLQKKLMDEDAKRHEEELLRAEEKRKEEEKCRAEENRKAEEQKKLEQKKLEEQKKAEEHQVNSAV